MAFDFIKTLLGVKRKPASRIVETMIEPVLNEMIEPVIQETLKITEKKWKSKETPVEIKPKRYTKKQLMEMTKKEINELSLSALSVKLDGRVRKEVLVEEFMNVQRDFHKTIAVAKPVRTDVGPQLFPKKK